MHCRIGDDPQRAGRKRPRFRQQFQRLRLDLEKTVGDVEQPSARCRQRHLFLSAVEQDDIIFLLQLAHLVGKCGLGQVQALGRPRKAAMDGDVVKRTQLHITHVRNVLI